MYHDKVNKRRRWENKLRRNKIMISSLLLLFIKNDDFEKTVQVIMTIIENEKRIEDERV